MDVTVGYVASLDGTYHGGKPRQQFIVICLNALN